LGTEVGLHEVTAILPEFQGRHRYRVRYDGSFIEQVVDEADLSPAEAMTKTPLEAPHERRGRLQALRQRRYRQGQLALIAVLSAALVAMVIQSLV
jgi:hypothetical protein